MRGVRAVCGLAFVASACVGGDLPARPSAAPDRDAGPDADAPMCPASQETNECFRCTDENCCVEYEACQADSRCTTYYKTCLPECAATKSYDECVIECSSSNHDGHVRFTAYYACAVNNCLLECGESGELPDPCITCVSSHCQDELQVCTVDPGCGIFEACLFVCRAAAGEPGAYQECAERCEANSPVTSKDSQNALWVCQMQYCKYSCGAD